MDRGSCRARRDSSSARRRPRAGHARRGRTAAEGSRHAGEHVERWRAEASTAPRGDRPPWSRGRSTSRATPSRPAVASRLPVVGRGHRRPPRGRPLGSSRSGGGEHHRVRHRLGDDPPGCATAGRHRAHGDLLVRRAVLEERSVVRRRELPADAPRAASRMEPRRTRGCSIRVQSRPATRWWSSPSASAMQRARRMRRLGWCLRSPLAIGSCPSAR